MTEPTYWNGEPCEARKVTLVVADLGGHPRYWAGALVGTRRDAVEVVYNGATFYLDDQAFVPPRDERVPAAFAMPPREAGVGWAKVTTGMGSPNLGHSSLYPEPGSVEAR